MELRIRFLKWSAGVPVAMLHSKTAAKIGVHANDRISIKTLSKKLEEVSTVVDIIGNKVIKTGEIAVSSELKKRLGLRVGQKVEINIASASDSLIFIKKKLNNKKLSESEISRIIQDVVDNSLSESEIALFVSSMYKHGMSMKETIYLINSIVKHGNKLNLKSKNIADKHSIGGVAGNRTTPIIVPICAAAGLIMPKSSSRAITTSAGTADVIETIARIEFSIPELKKIVRKTNACLVWGGSLGIVPADSKIIKVEKMLKIDPEAQLLASIMSKKLAAGSRYIIIDIPYGKHAKVEKAKALDLKKKFEYLGKHFRKKLKVVLTEAKEPMGKGVGPALELIDVINILDPKLEGPQDLEKKSLLLAGELLELAGKAKKGRGRKLAEEILSSGKAFEKFKQIIKAQGGKLNEIVLGKFQKNVIVKKSGKVIEIDIKKINSLARTAGCPADKFAGLFLHAKTGEKLNKGNRIITIYAESKNRLKQAIIQYNKLKPLKIK
ncbi:thymidine phosphorylase [Candidatus Pacearchaeota archaeon]|nr:thymidine phosphorylase [Candidatus Pacearchaeota archaeon]